MTPKSPQSSRSKQQPAAGAGNARKLPLIPILAGLAVIVLIVTIFLTLGETGDAAEEYGSPTVTGETLPLLPDTSEDPAIGMGAPEISGADFEGTPVDVTHDGTRKVLLMVAHWCPVCQDEVPAIQSWLDDNELPAGVELYSVATSINSARANYPPSAWLEREGWEAPVIVDDEEQTIGRAYGLTAFPYWVFLDAEGNVVGRITGAIGGDAFGALVENLAAQ